MRAISILVFAISTLRSFASYDPPAPRVLLQVLEAIENSRIDDLAIGGSRTSYCYQYPSEVRCLGLLDRDSQRFTVAYVAYTMLDSLDQIPPLRQGYILILDSRFNIVSYSPCNDRQLRMDRDLLISEDRVLLDFNAIDDSIRYRGFQIGDTVLYLPYPFKDRISEEDWKSGEFRKNGVAPGTTIPKGGGQPPDAAAMFEQFGRGEFLSDPNTRPVESIRDTPIVPIWHTVEVSAGKTVDDDLLVYQAELVAKGGLNAFDEAFKRLDDRREYMRRVAVETLVRITHRAPSWYVRCTPGETISGDKEWSNRAKAVWLQWKAESGPRD